MSHEKTVELLELYVFGALETDEFEAVEAHLASNCEICEAKLKELNELSYLMASNVPQEKPSENVKINLMSRIKTKT